MTLIQLKKIDLDSTKRNKFQIDPKINVYFLFREKIIEERADEIDYDLESMGYLIIHRDLVRVATSIYNYKVYCVKEDDLKKHSDHDN